MISDTQLSPTGPARSDNRAEILRAAGKLFAERGFQATTLRDIALGSGANGALVSYYFGGKEGLRDAVLAEKIHNLKDLGITESSEDALSQTLRAIFLQLRSDPNFHRLAQRALTEDAPFKEMVAANYRNPLLETLSKLIQTGAPLTPEQTEIRALALFGLIQQYGNMLCFYEATSISGTPLATILAEFEELVVGLARWNLTK